MNHLTETYFCELSDFFNLINPGSTNYDNVKKVHQRFKSLLHLLQASSAELQHVFEDLNLVNQIELYKHVLSNVLYQPSQETAEIVSSLKEQHILLLVALSHSYDNVEYFKVFYFNSEDNIIDCEVLHVGTSQHVPIDHKLILRNAQRLGACAVIVVHNHPSGSLKPSFEDVQGAQQLKQFLASHNVCLQQSYIYAQGQFRRILKLDFS